MGMTNASFAINVTSGMGKKHTKEQKQTRSTPAAICEPLWEQEWYISPFDGQKSKTVEQLEKEKKAAVDLQLPTSSSATSDTSAIVDEVRQAIHVELMKNFKTLGINPGVQKDTTPAHSTIDMVTPSDSSPALS